MPELAILNPLHHLLGSDAVVRKLVISVKTHQDQVMRSGSELVWKNGVYDRPCRSFMLVQAVDEAKTSARHENGAMSLVLPKKGNGGSKKISVA